MNNSRAATRLILPALFVFFCATNLAAQAKERQSALPNITLPTIDGGEWRLHENRGNLVILNFWATWCAPCRTETPLLVKLANEFEREGLKVAGVALDEDGTDVIRKFMAEYKIDYTVLVPPAGSALRNVENVPTTMLIDRESRLVKKYVGAFPEDVIRKDLADLISETARTSQR